MEEKPPPRRKRLRLSEYDYATAGAYFVTICVRDRRCMFGTVVNNAMSLNSWGRIVEDCWYDLRVHYPTVDLDAFVVMPNHVHGILALKPASAHQTAYALTEIVRAFKTFSARAINARRRMKQTLWQRGYFDRIIRNEKELMRIREYIDNNPVAWQYDRENPARLLDEPAVETSLLELER